MKLFLISQTQNQKYDSYDSAVVSALDEETARQIDPSTGRQKDWSDRYSSWCDGPEHVAVRYLGDAIDGVKHGILCASFNAG